MADVLLVKSKRLPFLRDEIHCYLLVLVLLEVDGRT